MRLDWRRKVPPGSPEWKRQNGRAFDMWNAGRWRELLEIWRLVPGLEKAIIHHVALYGVKRACGSSVMHASVAEG